MMYFVVVCTALLACCYAAPADQRIVNGTDAAEGEIPYIVSFRYKNEHHCGGSILDSNHILTAAHCVENGITVPHLYSIQYGVTHITPDETNSIQVKKMVQHPDYQAGGNYPNDVAVLTLEEHIPFSENVQPVVLSKQGDPTPGGEKAILAGWGYLYSGGPLPYDLQRVDIICYSDDDCSTAHNGVTNNVHNVCAGVPEGGKGQCNGDSGGPLYVNGVQVGVVSWSIKPCTIKGFPGVFAKVASYVDWINNERLTN